MEEAAKEKKVAKQEARKARRERAKTQQVAAAVAAKEEEEAEVRAATEIAMEHADPAKASKVESAVQIRPGSASDSALGLFGWRRGRSSSLGGYPQWSGHCLISRRCDPLCIREGCSGFAESTPAAFSDLINHQAWHCTASFRAFIVIGVAAVFGAACTQSSAFGLRQREEHRAAALPVLSMKEVHRSSRQCGLDDNGVRFAAVKEVDVSISLRPGFMRAQVGTIL